MLLLLLFVRSLSYRYHCIVGGGFEITLTSNLDVPPLWMIVSLLFSVDVNIGATKSKGQQCTFKGKGKVSLSSQQDSRYGRLLYAINLAFFFKGFFLKLMLLQSFGKYSMFRISEIPKKKFERPGSQLG